MKFRRIIYAGGVGLLLLLVLILDVIRKTVDLEIAGLAFVRDLMVIGAFILAYLFLELTLSLRDQSPVKRMGLSLVAAVVILGTVVAGVFLLDGGFDSKNLMLLPLGYGTLFFATFVSIFLGLFSVGLLRLISDLILFKRKKGTQRNLYIFLGLAAATSLYTLSLKPLESQLFVTLLYGAALIAAIVNSFRLSWIVYLSKREKIFGLIYSFFLFAVFTALNIAIQSSSVHRSLLYYSYPLREFVSLTLAFSNIYFGMAFVSTLFHLPTAEAFDKKTSEISSLHNLSRLVTQAFDFNELVDTVTTMTLQVCEARTCWLELLKTGEEVGRPASDPGHAVIRKSWTGGYFVRVVGMKNTTHAEIDSLLPADRRNLRDAVIEERKPIVVDDVRRDVRLKGLDTQATKGGSLVIVPLISHSDVIGILYATKETEHGFFKDDVDMISAFADQATIAIENSRLFNESLERERLIREMMLAQEMQRKLLPQTLPQFPHAELDASSTPAFEVGGDYYDVVELDDRRVGIIVGDVSGKGVSAAFYMSEVKGIFQSLSRLHHSPKDFIVKANEALLGSFDKRSFISLIYAIVDVHTGSVKLVRAGHCPLLLVSSRQASYVRPGGMGIGLSKGTVFASSIEEETLQLEAGDVFVLYTDGVTEARCGEEEFGYERLMETVAQVSEKSASAVKQHVLDSIGAFTGQSANHDDLTLVVMKWHGQRSGQQVEVS
jgi:phosphoserine phosphatase RsbU/P